MIILVNFLFFPSHFFSRLKKIKQVRLHTPAYTPVQYVFTLKGLIKDSDDQIEVNEMSIITIFPKMLEIVKKKIIFFFTHLMVEEYKMYFFKLDFQSRNLWWEFCFKFTKVFN